LLTKGVLLAARNRIEEALALIRHSLAVALDNDLPNTALRAYINLGAFMYEQDRHVEEREIAQQGLALARKTGDRWREVSFQAGGAFALFWLGRWDEAVAELDALSDVEDFSSVSSPLLELVAATPLFVERGDLERARALLALIPEGMKTGDVQTRGMVLTMLARLLRAEGRPAEALAAAKKAIGTRHDGRRPRV